MSPLYFSSVNRDSRHPQTNQRWTVGKTYCHTDRKSGCPGLPPTSHTVGGSRRPTRTQFLRVYQDSPCLQLDNVSLNPFPIFDLFPVRSRFDPRSFVSDSVLPTTLVRRPSGLVSVGVVPEAVSVGRTTTDPVHVFWSLPRPLLIPWSTNERRTKLENLLNLLLDRESKNNDTLGHLHTSTRPYLLFPSWIQTVSRIFDTLKKPTLSRGVPGPIGDRTNMNVGFRVDD